MRILAIHSNNIFFLPDNIIDEPEVPNFYEWMAEERGLRKAFKELNAEYQSKKRQGHLYLTVVYDLLTECLTREELIAYCDKYNEYFFNHEIEAEFRDIKNIMDIIILTSYPKELYKHLHDKGLAEIFGAEPVLNKNNTITGLKDINLRNPKLVREEMEKSGFGEKFTLEPNRYGLLELLIDKMIRDKVSKGDVLLLGKGITAEPFKRVSYYQFNNLDEILSEFI